MNLLGEKVFSLSYSSAILAPPYPPLCHLDLAVSYRIKNILPRLSLFKNYFPYGHLKDLYFSTFTYDNELIVMIKTYFFFFKNHY